MLETLEKYKVESGSINVDIEIVREDNTPKYKLIIPEISLGTSALLNSIKHELISSINITTAEILNPEIINTLKQRFSTKAEEYLLDKLPNVDKKTKDFLITSLINEMLGLKDIEYLLSDPQLEEIIITSAKESVRVFHKKYGWLLTNILIKSEEEIQNYANIIARRIGRQITTLTPILDAHLVTGDRANAVLYPISTKGNAITIRKFARDPWTVVDLIQNKTCSSGIFALIWLAMQYEMNILISGGTASGKCVVGDTEVYLKNNKVKIKNLVEGIIKNSKSSKIEDGFVADCNLEISSLNPTTLKLEGKKVSKVWKRLSPGYLYQITTASGRTVAVTPEHPFILPKNGIEFLRADKIKVGDHIAVPRHLDFESSNFFFDLTKIEGYLINEENGCLFFRPKNNNRAVRLPSNPNKELMRFVGYVIGDGHITKDMRNIRFFNKDMELLNDFKKLGKEIFGIDGRLKSYLNKTPYIEFSSFILGQFLCKTVGIMAGNKSHSVFLKDEFLFLNKDCLQEFIIGLFESEAGITIGKGELEFSSASRKLADNVSFILSRFGILHQIKYKPSKNRVFIAGKNLSDYYKQVGLISTNKTKHLVAAIKKVQSPNFDFVPGTKNLIDELCKTLRLRHFDIKGSLTREAISSYVQGRRNPKRESLLIVTNALIEKYNCLVKYKNLLTDYKEKSPIIDIIDRIRTITKLQIKDLALSSGVDKTTLQLWFNKKVSPTDKIQKVAIQTIEDYDSFYSLNNMENSSYEFLRIEGKEIANILGIKQYTIYPYLRKERKYNVIYGKISEAIVSIKNNRLKELESIKEEVEWLQNKISRWDKKQILEIIHSIKSEFRLKNASLNSLCTFLDGATSDDVLNKINTLKILSESDVLWDKIISIEKVRSNDKWVYDLTVSDNHTFLANNVVVHNTSFLNVCMPFIPPNHRIISIEDTRELFLPEYLYWCPLTTREPNPEGKGEVSMLDLLVNSLRMRPDRIILGEMRRKEQAEVLFEAMHTGHSVYATVHADSINETIQRLTNPPIQVPANLLGAVNLNVVMFRDRRRGLRRVLQIGEFVVTEEDNRVTARPNIIYRWKPETDEIVSHSNSLRLMDDLSRHTGMTLKEINEEIMKKKAILDWMVSKNIRGIKEVGKIMNDYYLDPNSIYSMAKKNVKK